MSNLLSKFSLSAFKFSWELGVVVAIIWLIVVGTCVSSIFSQPFSKKQRIFWTLVVVCLPLFGMLFYLPFSIKHDEYPLIFNWKSKK